MSFSLSIALPLESGPKIDGTGGGLNPDDYLLDQDGNFILDQNGNPIPRNPPL